MIAMFPDPQVAIEIGGLFGGTAQDIRDRANSSREAEAQGERAATEPGHTDEFVYQMRNSVSRRLEQIAGRLSNTGTQVRIEFHSTNMPVGEENQYGPDIGLRVTLRTTEAVLVKGLLVQCKRMYGSGKRPSYEELRGRGEKQAREMLRITPASFFMLFNSGKQKDLLDTSSIPIGTICPAEQNGSVPTGIRGNVGSGCQVWTNSDAGIWDMGIAMLPAARVLALSAGATASGSTFPVDAPTILRGCLPLGVLMVDLFGSCFVGDVREEVVRMVTPPGLRDLNFPTTGLPANDFAGFGVRHYIDVSVSELAR